MNLILPLPCILLYKYCIKQSLQNTKLPPIIIVIYLLHALVTKDHPKGKYLREN